MEIGLDQDRPPTVLGVRLQKGSAGIALAFREVSPGAIRSQQNSGQTGGARVRPNMYIPPWPGPSASQLSLRALPEEDSLPYPLKSSGGKFFYVARNGIYHLFR